MLGDAFLPLADLFILPVTILDVALVRTASRAMALWASSLCRRQRCWAMTQYLVIKSPHHPSDLHPLLNPWQYHHHHLATIQCQVMQSEKWPDPMRIATFWRHLGSGTRPSTWDPDHDEPEVLVPDTLPDLELEPEEDELDRELCEWCRGDWDWVWIRQPGECDACDACGLLAGPSPAPTSHAFPPMVDSDAMAKHARLVQLPWLYLMHHPCFNNLFMQYIQCLLITLQWWHVCEIQNVHPEPRLGSIDLWCKAGEPWCRWVESQVYQDGGKHIYQVHGDSQAITHGCASILHYLDNDCPDVVMQCLNGLFTLFEEVAQLILILQSMTEEDGVCIQPLLHLPLCTSSQMLHRVFQPPPPQSISSCSRL